MWKLAFRDNSDLAHSLPEWLIMQRVNFAQTWIVWPYRSHSFFPSSQTIYIYIFLYIRWKWVPVTSPLGLVSWCRQWGSRSPVGAVVNCVKSPVKDWRLGVNEPGVPVRGPCGLTSLSVPVPLPLSLCSGCHHSSANTQSQCRTGSEHRMLMRA